MDWWMVLDTNESISGSNVLGLIDGVGLSVTEGIKLGSVEGADDDTEMDKTVDISLGTNDTPVLILMIGTADSVDDGTILMDGMLDLDDNVLGTNDRKISHEALQV